MSPRARRFASGFGVEPFEWSRTRPARPAISAAESAHFSTRAELPPDLAPAVHSAHSPQPDCATVEREAFAKGFAQGERAGADAARVRTDAMLKRLAHSIDELRLLRSEMIRKTERQVVQLALAIAGRIMQREISLDRELLVVMARVALDRLASSGSATIHLHPDDHAVVSRRDSDYQPDAQVQVVADSSVPRGGCLVHSELGTISVGVDAQLRELSQALLGNDGASLPVAEA